jgi:hypothetical protein
METAATSAVVHHNPFEVLELSASATTRDVTRQKDKLLGMLELGLDRAKRYTSSGGEKERTPDLVRSAAQELERPRSRLTWEIWLKPSDEEVDADSDAAAMRTALVLHHELLREIEHGIAFGADELDELGLAWDEVLASDGLYHRVADRAADLGIEGEVDEVFDELCEEIRTQMLTMFERGAALDLDALSSEIATEVAHTFADRKVELLELACSRLANTKARVQRQQQWKGLVNEYAATVTGRGDYLRRSAFQALAAILGDVAVDLFNNNVDHATALSMFTWMRDEATNLEDDGLRELHEKNVTIVQGRIKRDEDALHAAAYQGSLLANSSQSEWGAGRVVWICIGLFVALLRVGRGCTHDSPSYSPPSYTAPSYRVDPAVYRDLQRNLEDLERVRQDPLPDYEPMSEGTTPTETPTETPTPSP